MIQFFISILLFPWIVFSNLDEFFSETEDPSIFHHVNVMSGNLNLSFEDATVPGAYPLKVLRTYSSAGALEMGPGNRDIIFKRARKGWIFQGGWNLFPHTTLVIEAAEAKHKFKATVAEPNGSLIRYVYSHQDKKNKRTIFLKPESKASIFSGKVSKRTNPYYNLLQIDLDDGMAILWLPNGGKRFYQGSILRLFKNGKIGERLYLLAVDKLPSGHQVRYFYEGEKRMLRRIEMTSCEGDKVYASLDIDCRNLSDKEPFQLTFHASDGKKIHYNTVYYEERTYLNQVDSDYRPQEKVMLSPGRKGIGMRLSSIQMGGKTPLKVSYHKPSTSKRENKLKNNPIKRKFRTDKVSTISAPVGPNGEDIVVAQFKYVPGLTEVKDAEGLLTRYYHSYGQLDQIEYFDAHDQLYSFQRFYWDGYDLVSKVFFDAHQRPIFAKTFCYEDGNVVEEVLWGTLTGEETTPLQIDAQGRPSGASFYRKTYQYEKSRFNLLKKETRGDGITYEYTYLPDTDLCILKLTKDEQGNVLVREFSFYDEDHLLIEEIIDDGISSDPQDKRKVTQRLEKRYQRHPKTGLPESVTESYWDPRSEQKCLLKKTLYTYRHNRVHTEEVFDSLGISRYTIETQYDTFGNVHSQTTPLGHENRYHYNQQGALAFCKEVGSAEKVFIYDAANRLIECQEPSTGKVTKTLYDSKGRIIAQSDFRGNLTKHLYDPFGNRISTLLPAYQDAEKHIAEPTPEFGYDIQGNLIETKMPGGATTQISYNLFRKPVHVIQADGVEIHHTYNKDGTLKQTLYQDGTKIVYTYDPFQRVSEKTILSPEGMPLHCERWTYGTFQLLTYTNERGLTTHFFYDGAGRKIREEAEDRTVNFTYDSLGFLERTDNGFVAYVKKSNAAGLTEQQWEEDLVGRIENQSQFFYNEEQQKTKIVRTTSQGEAVDLIDYVDGKIAKHTDPEGKVTHISYNEFFENELGQHVLQKTTLDPLRNMTIETHDAGERIALTEKKDPEGNTVFRERYFYDPSGHLAKRITTVFHEKEPQREIFVEWTYDAMGRVIEEKENGQKITQSTYDLKGRLHKKILPSGQTLTYIYDGADRLQHIYSNDHKVNHRYLYEQGPDPIRMIDDYHQKQWIRQYNLFGDLISETTPQDVTHFWEYDSLGRCLALTLGDNSSIHYVYEGAHLKIVQRRDSQGGIRYEHTYEDFDCNGHVSKEQLIHNLGSIHTTYDLLERPFSHRSPYMEHHVTYGLSGLIDQTNNTLLGAKEYTYDALNQLQKENDQAYHFDSIGNPSHYQVNALNQICQTPDVSLTYDPNGNPQKKTSLEETVHYQFDALGRLIEILIPYQKKVSYIYDPLSRLFSKEIFLYENEGWKQQDAVFYIYDRQWEIGTQTDNGAILELKTLGLGIKGDIGAAIAIELKDTVYAPLHDFSGHVVAILSSEGSLAETYPMNAFGKESQKNHLNPWRFASKRSEEGLVFFGLRFYDPSLGRWLNPDPAGFTDGPNLYVYVHNTPLNRLDLLGLLAESSVSSVKINIPVLTAPRTPGFHTVLSHGSIDGVKVDFVICCGHWHKLQFTAEEINTGHLNILDHLHELVPTEGSYYGLVTVGNGINTSFKECFAMTSEVGKEIGNTLLIALYNPTKGLPKDIIRTYKERNGVETRTVCLTRQFMATTGEKLYNINQQALWLSIPHSEHGVIMKRAVEGMTEGQQHMLREILHVFAVGPAEPISKNLGASVINVYSEKDYVTGFGLFGYASRFMNNPDYNIKTLACLSSRADRTFWIADHGFLKPTYRNAWMNHIRELKEETAFYGNFTNEATR